MAENLLTRLFKKRGITSVQDLSKDIKDFLKSQIAIIEGKWRDYGLKSADKAELLPLHTVYKALLTAIDAPLLEREQLEAYLLSLINQ